MTVYLIKILNIDDMNANVDEGKNDSVNKNFKCGSRNDLGHRFSRFSQEKNDNR